MFVTIFLTNCYRNPIAQGNDLLSTFLIFGIVPEADRKAVAEQLLQVITHPRETTDSVSYGKHGEFGPVLPDHVTTCDIVTSFLWRLLGDAGQPDMVQRMIMQPDVPGYLGMVNHGFTTIPENWNYPKTHSHNHDMYAGIFE